MEFDMTSDDPTTMQLVINAGLFNCKSCGWCCESCEPIAITTEDIIRLAKFLNKPFKVIKRKYTKPHPTDINVLAFKRTKPCFFYDSHSKKCKIYPSRPDICIAFPILSGLNAKNYTVELDPKCEGSTEFIQEHTRINEQVKMIKEDPRFTEVKKHIDEQLALKTDLKKCLHDAQLEVINRLWSRGDK